ncbi:MAG TPA: PepSY-associated TM helix domain-containing protein [Reyranella sp.]|nr:PepSY-associated TM helix domain-containing protein [Reyranella sp.]
MADAGATVLASDRINRRLAFVRWVRRTHGWFGLWGAILGLLMGFSGIWLNHRNVLKLDLPGQQQINAQLELPDPRPATIDALAAWLQQTLKLDGPANTMRVDRSRPVAWTERDADRGAERAGERRSLMQPERWTVNFGGPNRIIQAEYWVGNKSLGVRTTENGFVATLTNLHKGVGMPVPWILLIDTLAGSLIFLSISGAILWWETHRRRRVGLAIFGVSVAVTVAIALSPLQW